MATVILPVYGLVYLSDPSGAGSVDGFLSEHNRGEAGFTPEIIENKKRTVNGTMRSYVVTSKRTFNFSWDMIPADYAHTVDGYKGGADMLEFYATYYSREFYLYTFSRDNVVKINNLTNKLNNINNDGERYTVRFSNFQYDIIKRNVYVERTTTPTDLWNVSFSLEEV